MSSVGWSAGEKRRGNRMREGLCQPYPCLPSRNHWQDCKVDQINDSLLCCLHGHSTRFLLHLVTFFQPPIYVIALSRRNVERDKGGFLAAAAVPKCHFLSLANVEYCLEKAVSAGCKQPAIEYILNNPLNSTTLYRVALQKNCTALGCIKVQKGGGSHWCHTRQCTALCIKVQSGYFKASWSLRKVA